MKRLIVSAEAAIMVAYSAMAQPPQLEKGKIMLGATSTAGFEGYTGPDLMSLGVMRTKVTSGSNTYNERKVRSFSLIPKGGYFIIDNLSVGLEAMVSRSTDRHVDMEGKNRETTLAIGPWARYYYPLEKVYPFAELELIAGTCIEKYPTSGPEETIYRYSLFSTGLSLGVAVPLADMVTFDVMAGYLRNVWVEKESPEGTDIDFREIYSGPIIRMGFIVYL